MAELEPIKGYNCMKTAILYISRAAFAKKIIYHYNSLPLLGLSMFLNKLFTSS